MYLAIFPSLLAGGGVYLMYYSSDYLCHYGVLGMKWGQHIAAKYNSLQNATRQFRKNSATKAETNRTLSGETKKSTRRTVMSERREAQERVKFYGGKNAASRAIAEEAERKRNVEVLKGVGRTSVAAILGGSIGSSGYSTAAASALASGIGAVAFGAVAVAYTGAKIANIKNRAKRQKAYTDDLSATGNSVKVTDPYDDENY